MAHIQKHLVIRSVLLLAQVLFWVWNLLTLIIVYIGILPFVGIWLIRDTFAGLVPFDFLLTLGLLILVPTVSTIAGIGKYRKQPLQLIRLFYGVEAPLFLLALLRLFLIRERTAASTFLLLSFLIAITAFTIELVHGMVRRRQWSEWGQMVTHTLMFLAGGYVGAILVFYAFPAGFVFLKGFFGFRWFGAFLEALVDAITHGNISLLFWIPVGIGFFVLTVTAFISLPSAFATAYTYSGARYWRYFAGRYGKRITGIIVAAVCALWLLFFSLVRSQPQTKAFGLLANEPPNAAARRELLLQKEAIRKGLLNAYLHAYRYLSTREENNHIREMYHDVFDWDREVTRVFQNAYNALVAPLLYSGFSNDDQKAAELYGTFFDTPIQKGEQRAIEHALQSTYNRDEAKAGLLNINQEKVWLAYQQVTVEPHGEWAAVELYEVYENETYEEQEVFYSFSLPESAVMTGLWLGDSDDLSQRFEFQVSPRGAAQQVYNNQVRVRRDPALLEQVGPRHYRLRAFPIPQRRVREKFWEKQQPPRFHLWLTYAVLRHNDTWPLPRLGEKRNVFWTKKTRVNYNGYTRRHPGDDWLPVSLTANKPVQMATRTITLPGEYTVTAKSLTSEETVLPNGKRFAVLLDTSYSLNQHVEAVQNTFEWLQTTLAQKNRIDVYLTDIYQDSARRLDDVHSLNPKKLLFFGTIRFKDILRQFDQLRGNTAYDAILLITDEGSYELADDTAALPLMPAPLWMVHVSRLPKAYDDATLEAIQKSSGRVSTSVQEVVQRLAATAALGEDVISVTDGYAWFLEKPDIAMDISLNMPSDTGDGFTALAVRQLILGLGRRLDMTALENLDLIHTLAATYQIVSPYSSMIVLVNERQKEELAGAEAQADRFEREVETGHEVLGEPANPFNVPGSEMTIPEPDTMLLVGVAVVILGCLAVRRTWKTTRTMHK